MYALAKAALSMGRVRRLSREAQECGEPNAGVTEHHGSPPQLDWFNVTAVEVLVTV